MNYNKKVIVALDVDSEDKAKSLVESLFPEVEIFKVGLELFSIAGSNFVNWLDNIGAGVFLDLKFFDIPNTVGRASSAIAKLNLWGFTVHVSAGRDAMSKAKEFSVETAKKQSKNVPYVLGVTVLTSQVTGVKDVIQCATEAKLSGLDGVIASVHEAEAIKDVCGRDFLVVTPGIRKTPEDRDDQRRIATAEQAFRSGSDYIVVGRAVTKAPDPKSALQDLLSW